MSSERRFAAERARPLVDRVARDLPVGWRLLDWDSDQGLSLIVEGRGRELLIELSLRDDSVPCFARTERLNVTARDPFAEGRRLDSPELEVIASVTAALAAAEGALGELPRQATAGTRCLVRSVAAERALVREGRGQYYLNPYVGCTIGCSFCFVERQADLPRALDGLPRRPWGGWVDVKQDLPEVLAREVLRLPPGVVRMSPIVTDPYQPLERRHRVTRRCLEVLLPRGFSPCVLTRAARVVEDVPLLARFERALVGLSIPTDDDRVRHAFEPGADPIGARLQALRACRRAGLGTFAVIQPMLPLDPERLVARLAPWVDVVRVDRLHLPERVQSIYAERGWLHALDPAWFEDTRQRLLEGFARHGVGHHPLDDLSSLMGK